MPRVGIADHLPALTDNRDGRRHQFVLFVIQRMFAHTRIWTQVHPHMPRKAATQEREFRTQPFRTPQKAREDKARRMGSKKAGGELVHG